MNIKLKESFYKRIIKSDSFGEKNEINSSLTIIFAEKYANCEKYIWFYISDFMDEGELMLQVEYEINYSNGDSQFGDYFIELEDVLNTFGYKTYKQLQLNLERKYKDDNKAWYNILSELKSLGLEPNVDESES